MKKLAGVGFVFNLLFVAVPLLAQETVSTGAQFVAKTGVSDMALGKFFDTVKNSPQGKVNKTDDAAKCVASLQDTDASRIEFLDCLKRSFNSDGSGLNAAFAVAALDARMKRTKQDATIENFKTVALISWLEDLARVTLSTAGEPAHWLIPGPGFDPEKKRHYDFDYQHGDVIVEFGGGASSAMNAGATFPARRFSHAYFINVENGVVSGIEAMPKNGVSPLSATAFRAQNYAHYVVLRWGDESRREQIAKEAVACAKSHIGKQYDGLLNMRDQNKFFCSELVAVCLAEAKKKVYSDMLPADATVMDFIRMDKVRPEATKLFSYLGMVDLEYAAPGSIPASPDLVVAGDYRDPAQSMRIWQSLMLGESYFSLLGANNPQRRCLTVDSSFLRRACSLPRFVDALLGQWERQSTDPSNPFASDWNRLFPTDVKGYALPYLYTMANSVLEVAHRKVDEKLKARSESARSLLAVSPLELLEMYDRVLLRDPDVSPRLVKYDEAKCFPNMPLQCEPPR